MQSRPLSQDPARPPKRIRVTQACDRCRQTRRKCDSNVPKCAPCESQGNECSYANTRRKRGRPSGYAWALEIIIAHLLKEDPAVNNVIGQFLKRYMDPLQGTGATAYNDHRVQQLHVAWKESGILAQVNQFLTSENSSPNIDCVMHGTSSLQGGEALVVGSSKSERWNESTGQLSIESMEQWPLL